MLKYNVYLGDKTLYGVSEVEVSTGRAISVHNGLGQGNFAIGGDKDLCKFSLNCEFSERNTQNLADWSSATEMFRYFEKLLNSSEAMRLVVVTDYSQVSVPVLMDSYSKNESYAGVYKVGIKLTEYKELSVCSADVPYIKRAGKIPPALVEKRAKKAPIYNKTPKEPQGPINNPYDSWKAAQDTENPMETLGNLIIDQSKVKKDDSKIISMKRVQETMEKVDELLMGCVQT